MILKKAEDIESFAQHCVFALSCFRHGQILFDQGSGADRDRMSRASNIFFSDINRVLNEFIILQVCKITDPARDRKSENHTLAFMLEHYDSGKLPEGDRLKQLVADIGAFREKLLPARNKRIAHADRGAAFAPEALGAATNEEWNKFWNDLDAAIGILYEAALGEPFHILDVGIISDADGLLKALKSGACFDQLLNGDDAALTERCAALFFVEMPV